ncbi:MAG: CPBP family intramembrane metalloprotease [Anaerolineae bacterium]
MGATLDTRRIAIYLAFAFGLAWGTSLVVYLTGGLQNSPVLLTGTPVTLAFVLIASVVMWSPALAHIFTRLVTREGWQETWLKPRFRQGWPYWLATWFLPGLLTIAGLVIFFLLFPRYYDPSLGTLRDMLAGNVPADFDLNGPSLWLIAAAQVVQGMLLAPLINGLATFGEEFGWRAYLQPKLMPLGGRKAMLLMGLIWGVWHWPIILMGHNYGLDYPGAPWLGPLAMVWFTLLLSIFLGWATIKSGSVWPAVIGHAAINGMANLGVIFVQGDPNPLLGPLPVGLIGGAGFALVALLIFVHPRGLSAPDASRNMVS